MKRFDFIDRRLESPIQVPQTRSTFHPLAQRNAFRRPDARLQQRLCDRENRRLTRLIELKPHRWGWKVFEASGVALSRKDQAINYAENRASFRSGEIRIRDLSGNVLRTTRAAVRRHAAETGSDF